MTPLLAWHFMWAATAYFHKRTSKPILTLSGRFTKKILIKSVITSSAGMLSRAQCSIATSKDFQSITQAIKPAPQIQRLAFTTRHRRRRNRKYRQTYQEVAQ